MSVTNDSIASEVGEYLKRFPFGKTEGEVQEEFSDYDTEVVSEALDELVTNDKVIEANQYRWTG